MMGSARCSRSYGLTQGCTAQPPSAALASTAVSVQSAARRFLDAAIARLRLECNSLPRACGFELFLRQRSNLVQILALIAGLVAVMDVAHCALTIHDDSARHPRDFIELTHFAIGIEQYRKRDRRALEEFLGVTLFRLDIDSEQSKACRLVGAIELLEDRHLLTAWAAPARPEINQHYLALELAQGEWLAIHRGQLEARCAGAVGDVAGGARRRKRSDAQPQGQRQDSRHRALRSHTTSYLH